MESSTWSAIVSSMIVAASITWVVKLLNWLWFRPRRLEKILRKQGLNGNPYRPFLGGDLRDMIKLTKARQSTSIKLSDDVLPHILPYYHETLNKYGENSFIWFGPYPRLNITDPELIKEILSRPYVFQKPFPEISKFFVGGLPFHEGQKWSKHRKIVSPAFHLEKLKNMAPTMGLSCSNMVHKLKGMVSSSGEGGCLEIDMWPLLDDLSGDIISRTAFGSSYEQAHKIFQLLRERVQLTLEILQFSVIPGWRHLPTKANRRVWAISKEINSILRGVIDQRHKALLMGWGGADDLLGVLMESNSRFGEEDGSADPAGLSIDEVIEECKLFYLAGSETTSSLLVWTMVMLCQHPQWQNRAREEVMRVFGDSDPTFDGLNKLKTLTMILQEVLRLYPPVPMTARGPTETVKIGDLSIPAGVHLTLLVGMVHGDPEIWGDDAKDFRPQRFAEGVSNATKIQSAFVPFGSGPRICIGYNYAMTEAKMAMAMIVKHFSFELSPSYLHAPSAVLSLCPQYGAPIIMHNLQ